MFQDGFSDYSQIHIEVEIALVGINSESVPGPPHKPPVKFVHLFFASSGMYPRLVHVYLKKNI